MNGDYLAALSDKTIEISLTKDKKRLSVLYSSRGLIKHRLGAYTGAIEDINKAIQLDGTNALAYDLRSSVKYDLKDFKSAVTDLKQAKKLYFKQQKKEEAERTQKLIDRYSALILNQ